MSLTVSYDCSLSLTVSSSGIELLHVSHCLPRLLAFSHSLSCPMELLHISHCLSFLLAVSHYLFQLQGVDVCLSLSSMVAGCLSLSLLSHRIAALPLRSSMVTRCLSLSLWSHEVDTCLSLFLIVTGCLTLFPWSGCNLHYHSGHMDLLNVSNYLLLSLTFSQSKMELLHVSHSLQ